MKLPFSMVPSGVGAGRVIAAVLAIAAVVYMVQRATKPPQTANGQRS